MALAESESPSDIKRHNTFLSANLRNFSDEKVHRPGVLTSLSDVQLEKESIIECIVTAFYGNGNSEENRGYVSIVFHCQMPLIFKNYLHFKFSCVVHIQDVAGNKKFARTFTFPYDAPSENAGDDLLATYTIGRYISREIILNEQDDLLSNDCLQLKVEVKLQALSPPDNSSELEAIISSSFEVEEDSDGTEIVLSLDSEVAKHLYEVSSVFRALCDTPMIENSTGLVRLPDDCERAFRSACRIIMGDKKITFRTFDEIIGLYIFADKYDVQNVIRACRNFCKSILHTKNAWGSFDLIDERVDKISLLATFFNDDILKEIVDRFLKNQKDNITETRRKCEHRNINLGNVKCEYTGQSPYLYFQLEDENEDRSQFEFYN